MYGTDSMPETGEIVAQDCAVERAAQDAFALRSQMRAARAKKDGFFAEEIVASRVPGKEGSTTVVAGRTSKAGYDTGKTGSAKGRSFPEAR